MIIVAGHVTVEAQQRDTYLAGSAGIVEQARRTAGCLDFAITADLIDPGRVNVYERWDTQEALDAYRGSGPEFEHFAMILSASVAEYGIADERSPFT